MSDAYSDATRSNKIEERTQGVTRVEIEFYVNPTQESLTSLYKSCEYLAQLGSNGGMFGENPSETARQIINQYRKRFGGKEQITIGVQDIANFLGEFKSKFRIKRLAELSTRFQGINTKDKGYASRVEKNYNHITEQLTSDQGAVIRGEKGDLTGDILEGILVESGINEFFPIQYGVA